MKRLFCFLLALVALFFITIGLPATTAAAVNEDCCIDSTDLQVPGVTARRAVGIWVPVVTCGRIIVKKQNIEKAPAVTCKLARSQPLKTTLRWAARPARGIIIVGRRVGLVGVRVVGAAVRVTRNLLGGGPRFGLRCRACR